jgi:HPr kinase/phosphorylase
MQVHGSCAAHDGAGVLLLGPSGAGKSDLVLRLLERGFMLVADDRVDIDAGFASPPAALAGLLEVRGLGILRLPHAARVPLRLAATLGPPSARLPTPEWHTPTGLPLIRIDPSAASAAARVVLALSCVRGGVVMQAGAFAAPDQT